MKNTVTSSENFTTSPANHALSNQETDDPFEIAPFDEIKIKKHLQKQNSTNPFAYLTDNNSNLIGSKPITFDQIQLIESTRKLKHTLSTNFLKTNYLNNSKQLKKVNSLSNLDSNTNPTNDLIRL